MLKYNRKTKIDLMRLCSKGYKLFGISLVATSLDRVTSKNGEFSINLQSA